jgi:hypothetical protein
MLLDLDHYHDMKEFCLYVWKVSTTYGGGDWPMIYKELASIYLVSLATRFRILVMKNKIFKKTQLKIQVVHPFITLESGF